MKKFVGFVDCLFFQPFLFKKSRISSCFFKNRFFLSFGDSLLSLLNHYNISGQTEYALLPEFYCPDTTKFISRYLKVIFYKINQDFSVNKESYFSQIKNHQPRVIINYSFTGFSLTAEEVGKLKGLINDSTIIIEDCAHRVLDCRNLSFINQNHFYLDSIRKNSPLLGSHLVSQNKNLDLKAKQINFYKIKCQALQCLKGFFDFLAYIFKSQKFYFISGTIFEWQDKIIGNYNQPTLGSYSSFYLYNLLDLEKIKNNRKRLALLYAKYLGEIENQIFKILPKEKLDFLELNYFPLLVEPKIKEDLISFLAKKNIFIESLWDYADFKNCQSEINNYLYNRLLILPISTLVKENDIIYLAKEIKSFLENNAKV